MEYNELYNSVYDFLSHVAKSGGRTTYGEIAEKTGLTVRSGKLYRVFQNICTSEVKNGRPMLCSVVARKDSGRPGKGFFKVARDLGKLKGNSSQTAFHDEELKQLYRYWKS